MSKNTDRQAAAAVLEPTGKTSIVSDRAALDDPDWQRALAILRQRPGIRNGRGTKITLGRVFWEGAQPGEWVQLVGVKLNDLKPTSTGGGRFKEVENGGFFVIEHIKTECENCTYDTWLKQLEQWWNNQQWHCHYLVSDGARALIKLALSGLGCVSVADLFHALRALGRPIGSALGRQLAQLKKQHDKLQKQLKHCADEAKQQFLKALIEENTAQQQRLCEDQHTYHDTLEEISQIIHPFTRDTQQWRLGEGLANDLAPSLQTLTKLAQSYGKESAQKAIETFQSQTDSFAQGIEAWRQWVTVTLQAETPDSQLQNWLLSALLPWVYWLRQADKTWQPALKKRYQEAASCAYDLLFEQPLILTMAPAELERWVLWSQEFCAKYQRTSSAVEGRNGYLAKLHCAG